MGVIFGSMLLLVILSGFAGLKTFTLSYVSSIDPEFKIFPKTGKRILITQEQLNKLDANVNIASYSKIVEEKVFLEFKGTTELATIKGVDANYTNTVSIDSSLTLGQWLTPQSFETVMGELLAYKLKLGVFDFDNLKLIVPKPGKSQSIKKSINTELAKNVGQISVNDVYNNEYVFSSIEFAQKLLSFDSNTITNIEFKTIPDVDEALFREELNVIFNNSVNIKNKAQLNDAIHKMLNTENIAVYLIFTLILIIAMFNLIGSIIMMIIDKKQDLIVLSNLGTPIKDIKQIFYVILQQIRHTITYDK
jgi:lipoprotein-releasing system permease protein